MAKVGKKYAEAAKLFDKQKQYDVAEAIDILKKMDTAKFDETVELAVNLNVDPKYADQQVRGALVLPHGTGKSKTVLVFAQGDKEKEALAAGADYVGADDLVEKIKGGWLEFDVAIATPNMMGKVGRLGKILGPKGLMPNPKVGTVTMDVTKAVSESKAGKVEYRTDKAGNIHSSIGKISMTADQIYGNAKEFLATIIRLKPAAAKGTYIKSIFISSTMSRGIKVDPKSVDE